MTKNLSSMKKFLATATTAAIVVSAAAPAAFASELTDIQDYEFKAEIEALVAAGIIGGYPDGTFQPYKEITRGEAAIMIARAKGLLTGKDIPNNPFTDVNENQASYEAVLKLAEANIVSGFGNNEFRPNDKITRAQMAKYIVNAYGLTEGDGKTSFPDVSEDAALATFVDAVADAGIVSGYLNGNFGYGDPLKRGHFAKMVHKAEQLGEEVETLEIEAVNVIDLSKVEVTFNTAVDAAAVENFTIEGITVTGAVLSEDKKTVTLEVTGLENDKTYTVNVADLLVDGKQTTEIVKEFTTQAAEVVQTVTELGGLVRLDPIMQTYVVRIPAASFESNELNVVIQLDGSETEITLAYDEERDIFFNNLIDADTIELVENAKVIIK